MLSVREDTYYNEILMRRENRWACSEFGLVVARQNGKGSVLEAREIAGLFLFGEKTIIHSAHLFDTSRKHFDRVCALIEGYPDFRKEIKSISRSHGAEGIFLKTGQELLFKARSKGGARGFSGDLIVLDEAMLRLGSDEVNAIYPTISARPNGQIVVMGSAGTQESEHFGRMRNRALKVIDLGVPEKLLGWMEYSAELHSRYCGPDCEEHDNPGDPKTWARANPALGFRPGLTEEYLREVESKAMSPEGFAQERLSVGDWPVEGGGWRVIPQGAWKDRTDPLSKLAGQFAVNLDTSPDSAWTCITVCGLNVDGDTHVEVTGAEEFDYRPGIKWAIPRLKKIWDTFKPPFVVIDPSTPAGSVILELESYGIEVKKITPRDYGQSCGDFLNGIAPKPGDEPHVTHIGQAPLIAAAAAAEKHERGDLWTWKVEDSSSDITSLTSATKAMWGFKTFIYSAPPPELWFDWG